MDLVGIMPNKSTLMVSKQEDFHWTTVKCGNVSRGGVVEHWNSLSSAIHLLSVPPPMLVLVMSDGCVNSSSGNNNRNWQLC